MCRTIGNTIVSVTIVAAVVYMGVLWTVVCVGGNQDLWRFLEGSSVKLDSMGAFAHKVFIFADFRLTETLIPKLELMIIGLRHLTVEIGKLLIAVTAETGYFVLFYMRKSSDRIIGLLLHTLDTAATLVREFLIMFLHMFEPKVAPNASLALWLLLLVRLLDRVVGRREDLEELLALFGALFNKVLSSLAMNLQIFAASAMRLALAYGIVIVIGQLVKFSACFPLFCETWMKSIGNK